MTKTTMKTMIGEVFTSLRDKAVSNDTGALDTADVLKTMVQVYLGLRKEGKE